MKKVFITLCTVALSVAAMAQFSQAPSMTKQGTKTIPSWTAISQHVSGTNFLNSSETISTETILGSGKAMVIDYSATWCSWCYVMHQNGILEAIQNQLGDQVQCVWVEADASTSASEITGGTGSQGDWTVCYGTTNTVPYPIIDDPNFANLIGGTNVITGFPTVVFVSPTGYWCDVYGTDWGFGPYSATDAVSAIQTLLASYPQAGVAPTVSISGPERALAGSPCTFTAEVVSVDAVTSTSWTVDGTAAGSQNQLSYTFTTAGSHTVAVTVTNTTGSTTATLDVTVVDVPANLLSYTYGAEAYTGIGTGRESTVYWAASFPSNMLNGRGSIDHVDAYVYADYAGTYKMSVYSGTATSPQTLLGEVSVNVTAAMGDGYVTFTPTSTINIDESQTLWIVMSTAAAYPAAGCISVSNPNSDWISLDGSSWDHASSYGLNYSWLIDCYTSGTSGISSLNSIEMSVYPNPTSDYLTIQAENLREVSVLDMGGRVLNTSKTSTVDVRNLAAGTYIVRVVTENGTGIQKIVKE